MPIVTILGMPHNAPRLNELALAIQNGVAAIEALGLQPQSVTVFFPLDLILRTGSELIVKVEGLFHKAERTTDVRYDMSETIGALVKEYADHNIPQCRLIEVIPDPPYQQRNGFWRHDFSKSTVTE